MIGDSTGESTAWTKTLVSWTRRSGDRRGIRVQRPADLDHHATHAGALFLRAAREQRDVHRDDRAVRGDGAVAESARRAPARRERAGRDHVRAIPAVDHASQPEVVVGGPAPERI